MITLTWLKFPMIKPVVGKYCIIRDQKGHYLCGYSTKLDNDTVGFKAYCQGLPYDFLESHNCCAINIDADCWAYLPVE